MFVREENIAFTMKWPSLIAKKKEKYPSYKEKVW
jgi:hypothetical protein